MLVRKYAQELYKVNEKKLKNELFVQKSDLTWEQRKLIDVCDYVDYRGKTPTKTDSGVFLVTAKNVKDGYIDYRASQEYISEDDYEEVMSRGKPEIGDVLITTEAPCGNVAQVNRADIALAQRIIKYRGQSNIVDNTYLKYYLLSAEFQNILNAKSSGGTVKGIKGSVLHQQEIKYPKYEEQFKIGSYFNNLDNLITLHQCEPKNKMEDNKMLDNINNQILFCDYYEKWIKVYKEGAIRKVTLEKYYMTHRWLKKLIPELKICEMTRINYQQLLNDYALYHERQTTMDFHHQLKGAILDAVDEGLLDRDPTRKAIIKGKTPAAKKIKYINQFELHTLLNNLNLKSEINWDWFILIVAKTGLRFSEALALTPKDFDFGRQSISVSKTWDYKGDGGFLPTKNKSSVRKVQIDWQTVIQFSELIKGLPEDKPIFVNGKVYNSTVNDILARYCKKANVPVISVHGLRHTHASLLLFAGVSIASVARRLGHSSMNTTQKTYLHIIQELESQDVDLVMRSLSGLS